MNEWQSNRFLRLTTPVCLALFTGVLALFLLTRTANSVAAVNCNVPTDYGTIQAAINDTNCDTIVVAAGTYVENLTINRSLTLRSATTTKPTINGDRSGRVVTINGAGVTVWLEGLRLINGDATGATPSARNGGGILVTGGASLHGVNLHVENNIASTAAQSGFGGGVAVNTGTTYLTDTLVYSNSATLRASTFTGPGTGGGLYVNGDSFLSVTSSEISNNVASNRAGNSDVLAAGGGLRVGEGAEAYLSGNTWLENVARGSLSDACTTCIQTNASGDGGAIAVVVAAGTATITIDGDTFIDNIANASNADYGGSERAGGGGISLLASNTAGEITGNFRNLTMRDNVAKAGSGSGEGRGGAIHAHQATVIVHGSTIIDNEAALAGDGSGGGIYVREPVAGNYLEVVNSILAGNQARGVSGNGAQLNIDYTAGSSNPAIITHVTIADDTLNPKQGIYYNGTSAGDELTILNTIIANHQDGIRNVNATGKATARYMLFYGNTNNQAPGSTAFPDMTGWVPGDPDPLFVNPSANDYHILADSPAVEAGTDAGITVDIDGDQRPQSGGFDIGADEFADNFYLYLPAILKQ